MAPLRLTLTALALCAATELAGAATIDLYAGTPWRGWIRANRPTEVDVRLRADSATQVTIDVHAGNQTLRSFAAIEPDRPLRLYLPTPATPSLSIDVTGPGFPPMHRDIAVASAEAPLFAAALNDEHVAIDGFHTIAVGPDDLPSTASAYAAIDALVIDGRTLSALDDRQLGALLSHAADCGTIALSGVASAARRQLQEVAGCGAQNLVIGDSPPVAVSGLKAALSARAGTPDAVAGAGKLLAAPLDAWTLVAVTTVVYVGVAFLALLLTTGPALLAIPPLAALLAVTLCHLASPTKQFAVWAVGTTGEGVARYRAVQRFEGMQRGKLSVPLVALDGVRACRPGPAMRFTIDPATGRALEADFATRLMQPIQLCYSGVIGSDRKIVFATAVDGGLVVTNDGHAAWPPGVVIHDRLFRPLPKVQPGSDAVLAAPTVIGSDPAVRLAATQTPRGMASALWPLNLLHASDVEAGNMVSTQQWLLVRAPVR